MPDVRSAAPAAERARLDGPAFAPYTRWRAALENCERPSLARLNAWAHEAGLALPDGRALRFVTAPARRVPALAYEQRIAEAGEIATREGSLHDTCNALAWLAFPRTKAALNARHMATGGAATANRRTRVRDAATLLDESGLLFVCANLDIVEGLRRHRWRETFWARRAAVDRGVRAFAIGHGLLVKLLEPYPALTAKALVVPLDPAVLPAGGAGCRLIDAAAAETVARGDFLPARLAPLPVIALPGWSMGARSERDFDNTAVFRPLRTSPR
jgi:hypothetical protein